MEKILRVSQWVRVLLCLLATIHIAVFVYASFEGQAILAHNSGAAGSAESSQTLSYESPWPDVEKSLSEHGLNAVLLLGAPQIAFYLFIYVALFRLFGLYQQGILFSVESTLAFQRIGLCLLIWPLFNLLYPSLLTLSLFAMDVSVERSLSFALGTDDLKRCLAGLMLWVIGWIMAQGLVLQQEKELVI